MSYLIEAAAASKSVFGNHGSGTQNTHTGSGSQNNNNADGAQYNATAIYIIEKYYSTAPSGDPPSDIQELLVKERRACMQSLSFLNIDARWQDIASAHPTTCNWFFETAEFREWHDHIDFPNHNGVLWVKGKPGTGKSTLMKHTLEHCQRVFERYTIAAYFFNARGDTFEKTPLGMLRSLVFQLIDKEPSAYDRFVLKFRKKETHKPGWQWREPELREFLLSEIQQYLSKPLILLIDALDECSESDVRDVVEFLEQLSVEATRAKTTLNICLSSRYYGHISMKQYRELIIERQEHDKDIAIYVRDKLKKRDEGIESDLLAKASGIFMWVVLVVTMLNIAYEEGKVEAMQQKLRELPDDLERLFEALLGLDKSDKHETVLMLQWVLFARRLLKPEELYYAMLAGTDADNLRAWDPSRITRDDIRRRITHSSRGLIEVRKGDAETVQFIHESVNDFLLRNQRLQRLDATLDSNPIGASHDRLKDCCMSYIRMSDLPLPKDRAQAKSFGSEYPFLEYASAYVFDHVEAAQAGHVGQAEFLQRLKEEGGTLERVRLFHNSFEQKLGSRCVGGVDLLYMTAAHGYDSLVKSLLKNGANVNMQGGLYGTALHAAAAEGKEEIVRMLLEKGADVKAQGGAFGTALQVAAFHGNEEIVTMLLKKGADVNAQGGVFGTALHAAAFHGNEEIITMLLKKGADVNAQGGVFGTALHAAAFGGEEEIVAMLLEKDADINAQGGLYGTALQAAAAEGKEEIVRMLLEKGADVKAQGGAFGTALQAAAAEGNEEIVTILLKKGADVNVQGGLYITALQAAACKGNEEIVMMLLEKGADVDMQGGAFVTALQATAAEGNEEIVLHEKSADINAQGEVYSAALQAAAAEGNEETVRMLLEKGAGVNAQGGLYGTALHVATNNGKEEIVRILLEKGADVNAQGGLYGTALQAAAAKGKEEIVRMLLEKGADVDAQGGAFVTALQAAAAKGKEEIVRMLLEKGADVNAQGGPYSAALQAAAFEGKEEIVRMLLEKGADVDAQGGAFVTALQAAAFKGNEEIVTMLLKKGADVNAQGGVFGTALQVAALGGKEEIVTMLLKKGADVNAQGGVFGTALHAAAFGGEEEIVAMLLEKGSDITALGGSVLQVATFRGRVEVVASLFVKTAFGATLQAAVFLVMIFLFLWFNW